MRTVFLLVLPLGCTVAQNSQNISDPNNDPNVRIWAQSETIVDEVLPTMPHPQGVVGAVYNDFSGRWICAPNTSGVNCPLVDRPGGTMDGYSYSLNRGVNWTRVGTLPVPSCNSTPCITLLDGDPWLVSNGDRMLYSSMAEVSGDASFKPSRVAVASSADGITWGPFQIAAVGTSGFPIDKPSMAMLGDRVVLAYAESLGDCCELRDISVATTEFADGANTVWRQNRLFLPLVAASYSNPIIKIVSSTRAYLAYMVSHSKGLTVEFHVEQLTRTKTIMMMGVTYGDWHRDGVLFQLTGIAQTPVIQGATGGWRDGIPMGFAVGGPGADQLYLVYRRATPRALDGQSVSQIHVHHCDVSFCLFNQQQNTNFGWSDTNLYQTMGRIFTGHQLQPNVTAQIGSSNVAVTLYQQLSAGFTNLQDVNGNPLPDSPPDPA